MTFILNSLVVISSLLAGLFWLASATGYTIAYPWKLSKPSVPVAPADLPAHETYWNAPAALCVSGRPEVSQKKKGSRLDADSHPRA
jgi:hypothetical protein